MRSAREPNSSSICGTVAVGPDPDDDPIGLLERVDRGAEPQVLRRAREGASRWARLLEQPRRTDGKLRRDEDHGVRVACFDEGSCPFHDEGDVGPIVRVDRGVVGDPDQLRASRSLLPVGS